MHDARPETMPETRSRSAANQYSIVYIINAYLALACSAHHHTSSHVLHSASMGWRAAMLVLRLAGSMDGRANYTWRLLAEP